MSLAGEVDTISPPDAPIDLATETLYRFLAALLSDPRSAEWALVVDPPSQRLVAEAADLLREEKSLHAATLGYGELTAEELDAKAVLAALRQPAQDFLAEFVRVFGLVNCRECPPYETEYHANEDTFFRSQQMADVAGFYQAFGLQPAAVSRERPDHLALELEFCAFLLMKQRLAGASADHDPAAREQAQLCREARAAFVRDHLSWWLPSFSLGLRNKAQDGLYEAAGRLLAALLPIERTRLGVSAPALPILQPRSPEPADECAGCGALAD